jgi:DNA-binding CsgD family transcriptional regulator
MEPAEFYSAAIQDVASLDDLESLTSETFRRLSFGNYILSSRALGAKNAFGPYNRDHLSSYADEGFYLVDPVAQSLETTWLPVSWDCRDHLGEPSRCGELFERSRDVGYQCGISTSIHGPLGLHYMLVSIFDGRPDTFQRRRRELSHEVLIIGSYLARAHHDLTNRQNGAGVGLTERERQCLVWTSRGKTAWEIASILGVRERTVNFHLQNAMAKLETSSKHHAWLKAASLGMLES